ncbi:MAG: DUF99 family protein [Candidatus Bathyarchaeota archaeon]|nr:DUF99 family protein [Candidatus Bathyarchaeota archaeon]
METYNLRQVKKEIRVLGTAVKPAGVGRGYHVVGAVFRGRLCLDGIMRTRAEGPDVTREAVEMIVGSPHHPQIRVVMLQGDLIGCGAKIDPYALSSGTSRPVIALNFDDAPLRFEEGPFHRFSLKRGETPVSVISIGLRSRVALRVLEKAAYGSSTPEALRVAGLVVSALSEDFPT